MKPCFTVNDVTELIGYIPAGGIQWSRNDIDSKYTKRSNLTAKMYRKRLAKINQAISPETIKITFLDPLEGKIVTKEFYGSTVDCTTQMYMGGETYWEGTSFNLIEL